MTPQSVLLEPAADHLPGRRLITGQQIVCGADQVHLAAETAEGLSQLALGTDPRPNILGGHPAPLPASLADQPRADQAGAVHRVGLSSQLLG